MLKLAAVIRFGKAFADFEGWRFGRGRVDANELVAAAIVLRNSGAIEPFTPDIDERLDHAVRYIAMVDGATAADRYELQRARDAFHRDLAKLIVDTYAEEDEAETNDASDVVALVAGAP